MSFPIPPQVFAEGAKLIAQGIQAVGNWIMGRSSIPMTVSIDIRAALHGRTVYFTDALRSGIMLRDNRMTLRGVSAMTGFVVHAVDDNKCVLQVIDTETFVAVGDKGAFYVDKSKEDALKNPFDVKKTELGMELHYKTGRPGVFDHHYDISVGEWEKGRSRVPILVHFADVGAAEVWPQSKLENAEENAVEPSQGEAVGNVSPLPR